MKMWQVEGEWLKKTTNRVFHMSFEIFNDGADPLETINKEVDMSDMVYQRGKVEEIKGPAVRCVKLYPIT